MTVYNFDWTFTIPQYPAENAAVLREQGVPDEFAFELGQFLSDFEITIPCSFDTETEELKIGAN